MGHGCDSNSRFIYSLVRCLVDMKRNLIRDEVMGRSLQNQADNLRRAESEVTKMSGGPSSKGPGHPSKSPIWAAGCKSFGFASLYVFFKEKLIYLYVCHFSYAF